MTRDFNIISNISGQYESYAPRNPHHDGDPVKALFAAIDSRCADEAKRLVSHHTLDLSVLNEQGQNPVHLAIASGQDDVAEHLIAYCRHAGSNAVHEMDHEGFTPLMLAVARGSLRLIHCLIELRAAVQHGYDSHCSPQRLFQKRQVIAHCELLLDTRGDIAAAYKLALQRGVPNFEKVFQSFLLDLRRTFLFGQPKQQSRLLALCSDPAFFFMRILADRSSPLSPIRRQVVRKLTAVVDLSIALKHAIDTNEVSAITTLRCLGANGDQFLRSAVENRDAVAVQRFLQFVSPKSTLTDFALEGNVNAVRFLLSQNFCRTQLVDALVTLARGIQYSQSAKIKRRHENATRLVLDQCIDPHSVLVELLKRGNRDTYLLYLPSSGRHVDGAMKILAMSFGTRAYPEVAGFGLLLSHYRVSPDLLCTMAKDPSLLFAVKILIAAGCRIPSPQEGVVKTDEVEIYKRLEAAASEVEAIKSKFVGVKETDVFHRIDRMEMVACILRMNECQADNVKKSKDLHRLAHQYLKHGKKLHAAVISALAEQNWSYLMGVADVIRNWMAYRGRTVGGYTSCDDYQTYREAFSDVLAWCVDRQDLPRARMMAILHAPRDRVFENALKKGGSEHLKFLLDVGYYDLAVLKSMVDSGHIDAAKALVRDAHIDLYRLFEAEDLAGNAPKRLIPSLTTGQTELLTALRCGDTSLTSRLIDGGADVEAALLDAIEQCDVQSIKELVVLKADKAEALLRAVRNNRHDLVETLLFLGADPKEARARAIQRAEATNLPEDKLVVASLPF